MKKSVLKEKNKKFWKLPAAEKRVAVAKDVIMAIKSGFYIPERGTYLRPVGFGKDIDSEDFTQLNEALKEIEKKGGECTVCGIGGCFVSMVRLGDKYETLELFGSCIEEDDEPSDTKMKSYLSKVFSRDQLSMIECAFEKSTGHGNADYELRELAADWGESLDCSDHERMIAIMKNIIKNNGKFKPVLPKEN